MSVFSKKKEPLAPIVDETAPVVVKVYVQFITVPSAIKAKDPTLIEHGVIAQYEADANRLAQLGYAPVATAWLQTMSEGGYRLRASLTVTYIRRA